MKTPQDAVEIAADVAAASIEIVLTNSQEQFE